MTLPVIIHPDVISFFHSSSQTDFGNRVWKCINKLKQQQFDGGLRVKKLKGITKRVWEARVTQAVRLIFTYTKSIQPDTGEPKVYLAIQDLCLDHDDVSQRAKARQRTPDNQWLDAEELETVGSLETERTSLTPDEQSAIDEAEAEELKIPEEVVDELVGNIQWRVVESESEWQQAITNQDVDLPLKLTPEEYELVNYYGNLLLSGNAGTGKTTVGLYRLLKSLETLPEGKRLYVAYNPVLVKEAKQQFNRLVGTKINEVESLFEFKTIRDLCLDILEETGETYLEANEVTYQAFDQLYRRAERNQYPPALVWDEIRSIIKGSCLETDQNLLSKNQYKKLGKKRSSAISTKEERLKIYELADWYQRQLNEKECFDEIDLTKQVLKLIKQGTGNRYEMIICDEVQDLTELQLHLLLQLVTPNGHLFFAGDLNQIINPSGFRWKDLNSEFYRNNRPVKEETLHFNFRSVGSLDQLANQLLKLKSRLLNERVNELSQVISGYGEWARLINAPLSNLKPTLEQLYPQDAILVRTEAEKNQLSNEFQSSFVFTIEEAKGLEFDTVFLVEFFQACSSLWKKVLEGKGSLKDKEKPELRRELNLLYVAITRTRRILNIWENQLSSLWTQEEVDSFTQQIEPESVRELRVEPTAEMWKERGLYYLEAKFYRQAIECFKFSGDFQLQRQSEAKSLLQEGKESEAIEIFLELGEHKEAAQLFEKQKQWEKAAEQYELAGSPEKVAECKLKIYEVKWNNYNDEERLLVLQKITKYGQEGLNSLDKFLKKISIENKCKLAENPKTPVDILQQLAYDNHGSVRSSVAFNENTSTRIFQKLTHDENSDVRKKVAFNENTPNSCLQELIQDKDKDIREILAVLRDNISISILQQLAQDQESDIREGVASNLNTPRETLQQLAQEDKIEVKEEVASNPNTPRETLQQLAQDKMFVKGRVASNPNTPAEALQQLAQEDKIEVRKKVASNPNTPAEALQSLANDQELEIPKHEESEIRQKIACNPNTPVEVLQQLAQDYECKYSTIVDRVGKTITVVSNPSKVRQSVASNPNTPIEILQQLALDKDIVVRKVVAKNPNTPEKLLQQLALDKDIVLRKVVAKNPNTPVELLQQLALDESELVRREVAENANTPVESLQQLALDGDLIVRQQVAKNPNTPVELLQ